jgi:HlyD family secretion protein
LLLGEARTKTLPSTTEPIAPSVEPISEPAAPETRPLPDERGSEMAEGEPAHHPHWSRREKWLALIALTIVTIVAVVLFYSRRSRAAEYTAAGVDRGDIESTVTATGNCNAMVTVQVGSQVSGNIIALYADFNTKVKQGQLVARIDPAMFQARVDQAKANLDNAKAAVVTARATVKKADADIANAQANQASQKANVVRAESAVSDAKTKNARRIDLVRQGVIAQEDADTAKATYDQAVASLEAANAALVASQSAVEAARAQREVTQTQLAGALALANQDQAALRQASLDLAHTEIRAPVDGTVVSRNMDVGQTVAASFQAPTIFLIAQDLTKMQVDTNVDESDVGHVRVGQAANFTVDAYPGVTFPGTVSQIRQAPINVQNVVTYDVVVQVANPNLKLFPGMTATVRIVTDRATDALRVPVAALRFRPASKLPSPPAKQAVYVLEGGEIRPVAVQLGISDGKYIQVLSGLTEGQRVVVGANARTPATTSTRGTRRVGF